MNWKTCKIHGDDKPNAWGCPECLRELREENKRLRAQLDKAKTPAIIGISTIADIRRAIKGRKDDEAVLSQVVALDGTAWSLAIRFLPMPGKNNGIVAQMHHPDLINLPMSK